MLNSFTQMAITLDFVTHLKFLNADFTEKVIANIMCLHHGDLESLEISVSRYGNFNWSPNDELIWKSVLVASVKESETNYFEVSSFSARSNFSVFLRLPHFFGPHSF